MRTMLALIGLCLIGPISGCVSDPVAMGASALQRQQQAAVEVRAALKSLIAKANEEAAQTNDVIHISEGERECVALYVPVDTPTDAHGPETHWEDWPPGIWIPKHLPPPSAVHKTWMLGWVLAEQSSCRFELLEVVELQHVPGRPGLSVTAHVARTVRSRRQTFYLNEDIPDPPADHRLWEAKDARSYRVVVRTMDTFTFPMMRPSGKPYGDDGSEFDTHRNWIYHAVSLLRQRPFEEHREAFVMEASYSNGRWGHRFSNMNDRTVLIPAGWSPDLPDKMRTTVFSPVILEHIQSQQASD